VLATGGGVVTYADRNGRYGKLVETMVKVSSLGMLISPTFR
jgi:hypothetical protein